MLRMLCLLFNWHRWTVTRINPFGIVTEETCSDCGAARHHLFKNLVGVVMGDPIPWRPGRHPGTDNVEVSL